jgi:hypothetical protein
MFATGEINPADDSRFHIHPIDLSLLIFDVMLHLTSDIPLMSDIRYQMFDVILDLRLKILDVARTSYI